MNVEEAGVPRLSGFLNLDKPSGITSRGVVNRVVKAVQNRRLKVGHAGTLDPLASGVLVVALGSATRLIEYVQQQPKTYQAVVRLGVRSDTLDADGTVVSVKAPRIPEESEVRSVLERQVGSIEQLPPDYSALRIGGKRAYDLARSGEPVTLAPRTVQIYQIKLVRYQWPKVVIEVDCGAGTYIRSIARDLGDGLGCGGLIEVLRRTRIGAFRVEGAVVPEEGELTSDAIPHLLCTSLQAVETLPKIQLSSTEEEAIVQGRAVRCHLNADSGSAIAMIDRIGELVGIGQFDRDRELVRPRKVLKE